MAKTTITASPRTAWERTCDCGFMLRDYNEDEFVSLIQQHVKTTHGQTIDRAGAMQDAKRIG